MLERAVHDEGSEIPPGLNGLSSIDARRLLGDYDFDAVGKHMSHVWHALDGDETYMVAAKGAVEGILAHSRCDESERRAVLAANGQMAAQGLRVLALAGRRMHQPGAGRDEDERDLTVYGLLGFQDPLAPRGAQGGGRVPARRYSDHDDHR